MLPGASSNLVLSYARPDRVARGFHRGAWVQVENRGRLPADNRQDGTMPTTHEDAQREFFRNAILHRAQISAEIFEQTQGEILHGIFAGMKLLKNSSWVGDGDIAPKILGFYEMELAAEIRRVSTAGYDVVVNVGAAEGYYAVGMARMMPHSRVYAFDIDKNAQAICREAGDLNGVGDRLEVGGQCGPADLSKLLEQSSRPYVVMDIEGAEKQLLCPEMVPALLHADFLVECHDFSDESITPTLQTRFADSHELRIITQAGRNPNRIDGLRQFNELDRWLTVCEFRPVAMHWLLGRARSVPS